MLLSDVINEQMKQYAVCNADFNEIQQEMNRIEDRFDEIVPCAQSLENKTKLKGIKTYIQILLETIICQMI